MHFTKKAKMPTQWQSYKKEPQSHRGSFSWNHKCLNQKSRQFIQNSFTLNHRESTRWHLIWIHLLETSNVCSKCCPNSSSQWDISMINWKLGPVFMVQKLRQKKVSIMGCRKSQRITEVRWIHPRGTMNVCTHFNGNSAEAAGIHLSRLPSYELMAD